ncbi:hypothetical protein DX928_10025 [Bacillus swezeyi]|uniref:Uncharacterized protein n=1 Tax=Bacillus swezeyi TaxID=1925020 RepID=A0A5M8S4C7_9BACI|nr:hypothetical protein DX927_01900 [Bacillus swezeyi]KAA6476388.1 hypothetical protein DX928_10025 [Bacillus swezeyi]
MTSITDEGKIVNKGEKPPSFKYSSIKRSRNNQVFKSKKNVNSFYCIFVNNQDYELHQNINSLKLEGGLSFF